MRLELHCLMICIQHIIPLYRTWCSFNGQPRIMTCMQVIKRMWILDQHCLMVCIQHIIPLNMVWDNVQWATIVSKKQLFGVMWYFEQSNNCCREMHGMGFLLAGLICGLVLENYARQKFNKNEIMDTQIKHLTRYVCSSNALMIMCWEQGHWLLEQFCNFLINLTINLIMSLVFLNVINPFGGWLRI